MVPTIFDGDILCVDPQIKPQLGEIAVFPHQGRLVAHRVIAANRNRLIAAGDASRGMRESVNAADVLGIVRAVSRDGQTITRSPRSVWAAILLRIRLSIGYRFRVGLLAR
ncbi:MAG: S24/S26 family peptidase [Candidatus Eremiobacteraeota bacterium]|nr:S24/S26 family peptidase [Candidatus Eremiobacteraeota bacterium]